MQTLHIVWKRSIFASIILMKSTIGVSLIEIFFYKKKQMLLQKQTKITYENVNFNSEYTFIIYP